MNHLAAFLQASAFFLLAFGIGPWETPWMVWVAIVVFGAGVFLREG